MPTLVTLWFLILPLIAMPGSIAHVSEPLRAAHTQPIHPINGRKIHTAHAITPGKLYQILSPRNILSITTDVEMRTIRIKLHRIQL
jgi:hypothetical protein